MNPDPFLRNTFWTVSIGMTFAWVSALGIHPGAVQRFVALPSYYKARKSLIYFVIGMGVVKILTGSIGMLIYTKYKDCDPTLANVSELCVHIKCIKIKVKYSKDIVFSGTYNFSFKIIYVFSLLLFFYDYCYFILKTLNNIGIKTTSL